MPDNRDSSTKTVLKHGLKVIFYSYSSSSSFCFHTLKHYMSCYIPKEVILRTIHSPFIVILYRDVMKSMYSAPQA